MDINNIYKGNCLDILKDCPDNFFHSVVTDPPYGLSFMGKKWDYDVPSVEVWKEVFRVLKPGGYLLCFAGTRTHHRMACNIEDAGFEIRDMIAWVYGSGFPKSRNVGKDVEKTNVGGIKKLKQIGTKKGIKVSTGTKGYSYSKEYVPGKCMGGEMKTGDIPVYEINNKWGGWGTALKPALEPITMARKPLSEKNIATNVLKHETGGINIDGCRVGTETMGGGTMPDFRDVGKKSKEEIGIDKLSFGQVKDAKRKDHPTYTGRFPSNFIHDGGDDVKDLLGESGRFFYCAKASKKERNEGIEDFDDTSETTKNNHPTVKPTELMRYLVRLVTTKDGIVLDPFIGSGSTGKACVMEGFNYVGCELSQEYIDIANARIQCEINKKKHRLF